MIAFPVDGLLWLIASLVPFILAQRWLSRELQLALYILTRKQTIALGIYSLLLFPGVFIHEMSHFLMARILLVHTGKISLIPRVMPDGRLRMGYVETEKTDVFRDAFIGAAPIISGAILVTYLWTNQLGLQSEWHAFISGNLKDFINGLQILFSQTMFWLWLYLALAVSNTMLPSNADRRSWIYFGLILVLIIALGVLVGMGNWMAENVAPWLNARLNDLAKAFGASFTLQLVLAVPLILIRFFLERLIGYPSSPAVLAPTPQKKK